MARHPEIEFVNVNVTVPTAIPVATPALVTDATDGLLLVQIPPVDGDNAMVFPTVTEAGAVTTGKALTVIVLFEIAAPHEFGSLEVNLKVTVPE